MPTSPRPVSSRAHLSTPTGIPTRTATLRSLAQRLGVPASSLLGYLDANGGAPDGGDHGGDHGGGDHGHDRAAALTDQRRASGALPEHTTHRGRRAPWVKRDRPRYFIPG